MGRHLSQHKQGAAKRPTTKKYLPALVVGHIAPQRRLAPDPVPPVTVRREGSAGRGPFVPPEARGKVIRRRRRRRRGAFCPPVFLAGRAVRSAGAAS